MAWRKFVPKVQFDHIKKWKINKPEPVNEKKKNSGILQNK